MTKTELIAQLANGKSLDSILKFRPGQDCMIFKAEEFRPGKEILYIPDIDLNEIPVDKEGLTDDEIESILNECFTGDDFLDEAEGNRKLAQELFNYVDWQHPSSVFHEVFDW